MIRKRGFTLIELLIVIAIIAVLITILAPALRNAIKRAKGTHCMMNLRTLAMAWANYADENKGKLCSGEVWINYSNVKPSDWVHPYIQTSHPKYHTGMSDHERELEGIRSGSLFPYTGKKVGVYNCPADEEWLRFKNYNANTSPFRSFAITNPMNGQWGSRAYVYTKLSAVTFPEDKLVFLEEQENFGSNWGSWILPTQPTTRTWWDAIAIWHSKASTNLGYADGHAQARYWISDSTLYMAETQQQGVNPGDSRFDGIFDDLNYVRSIYHEAYNF